MQQHAAMIRAHDAEQKVREAEEEAELRRRAKEAETARIEAERKEAALVEAARRAAEVKLREEEVATLAAEVEQMREIEARRAALLAERESIGEALHDHTLLHAKEFSRSPSSEQKTALSPHYYDRMTPSDENDEKAQAQPESTTISSNSMLGSIESIPAAEDIVVEVSDDDLSEVANWLAVPQLLLLQGRNSARSMYFSVAPTTTTTDGTGDWASLQLQWYLESSPTVRNGFVRIVDIESFVDSAPDVFTIIVGQWNSAAVRNTAGLRNVSIRFPNEEQCLWYRQGLELLHQRARGMHDSAN
jgi:hypothetical protein